MSADDLARRREQLRRACEDGERLYRLLMHGGGGFGGVTVADDHRLSGILTRELECALALVDELRAALVRDPVLYRRAAFPVYPPAPPAGADEPEADPPQTVAADPAVVDAESDTVYGDAMREHERQSWLRRVQAQPIR